MTVYRRAELLAAGFSDRELHRMRRRGELCTVRRGAYLHGPPPDDVVDEHTMHVRAAVDELSNEAVVSHVSAAVLHRLPLWGPWPRQVQVTRSGRCKGGRRGSVVHVRMATLDPAHVLEIDGLRVTSVERTIVDIGRSLPYEQALVVADGALGRETTQLEVAWGVLAGMRRWPGARSAFRVLQSVDGRSESVGETRSRIRIAEAGRPAPHLQWTVPGTAHRVDFAWPERRTVGEFDGRIKYGRLLRPGQEPGDVVFAEKRREDEIRDHGWEVVRWVWDDLAAFGPVAARLRARFR